MSRVCLKCGHVRTEDDDYHPDICPKCGAVYEKIEKRLYDEKVAAINNQEKSGQHDALSDESAKKHESNTPKRKPGLPLFAYVIIMVVVWLVVGSLIGIIFGAVISLIATGYLVTVFEERPGRIGGIDLSDSAKGEYFIQYQDSEGHVTEREISDCSIDGYENIRAYCHLRRDKRTFRPDRIISIVDTDTGEVVDPWKEFGLRRYDG